MTREEAIDVLKHNYPSACFTDLCEAVEIAIQALSAEPQRKKGKWTLLPNGDAICQECKHVQKSAWDMDGWDNFCHHCGADMMKPEDIPMEYYESGGR